ncbi:MAG TPA: phage terminase small subunit P27 family [Methylophilaceae bacterium]|nr:phage terminase small subunit P27 family [Methylophilaceae bacterium]
MSSRGPKPLPANVHLLRGNPSKKTSAQLMDSLQPEIEIPDCPSHLLTLAKKEWKRITPELERYGLISKLDRAALASYCQTWAMMVYAETQLKRDMEIAARKRKEAEDAGLEYVGGDGMVMMTTNGNMIYSPYYAMANRSRYVMDRMLANFGMSPSSRGRVNQSNHLQKPLFDEDEGRGSSGGLANI